jgi:hypothetical protein
VVVSAGLLAEGGRLVGCEHADGYEILRVNPAV